MEKKYFEAPYLKVVEVKNDILTTSPGGEGDFKGDGGDAGNSLAPGRNDFFGDDEF